jgi:pimeloyl-ACP methyl ester carboxylesterase
VISFDNRGAGRSDQPSGPYSINQMENDTIGLLDAIEVERADIFGVSMGGMIAQEIAVLHPDRVDRLVLGATSAGGGAHRQHVKLVQRISVHHLSHLSAGNRWSFEMAPWLGFSPYERF